MSLQSIRSTSRHRRAQRSGIRGLKTVNEYLYGVWRIEIDERLLGTTVKRRQFSATIRCKTPYRREFLSGFATKEAAQAAAEQRADELGQQQQPLWQPAGRRLTQRK